uniref:hypothetical protein n=1 Tax=Globicatella sulfidifaciens TaxID=136093 RepID=UPI0023F1190C
KIFDYVSKKLKMWYNMLKASQCFLTIVKEVIEKDASIFSGIKMMDLLIVTLYEMRDLYVYV